jgi:hypothetical protein
LPYACLLSTKGAYYGAKKQAQIRRQLKHQRCLKGMAFICACLLGANYPLDKQAFLLSTFGA